MDPALHTASWDGRGLRGISVEDWDEWEYREDLYETGILNIARLEFVMVNFQLDETTKKDNQERI